MRSSALALAIVCASAAVACDAQTDEVSKCGPLERRPALFVHGSGLSSSTWDSMKEAFFARGYRVDWMLAVDLTPNDGANAVAAERDIAPAAAGLLEHAQAMARRSKCRAPGKVDIVAHSMGAVSSRWFAARLQPQRVHTWVGIAPANHGTDKLCGHSGAGNREMCPAFAANGVQGELNGSKGKPRDETPYGAAGDSRAASRVAPTADARIYYYTVRIDPDEWIEPAESAVLDGAGGLQLGPLPPGVRETTTGNLLWQERIPHDSLPGNSDVAALVLQILAAPPRPPPPPAPPAPPAP